MKTPIADFVKDYNASVPLRLHMPGHKGKKLLGAEELDITEIDGADSLFEAQGIIRESEKNASGLFGCRTFYSAEGSSQCIRSMLYLAHIHANENGLSHVIVAARNVHKTFLSGAALLGFDIEWIYPNEDDTYLSCTVTAEKIGEVLANMAVKPAAVYLTSPDYLGNIADVSAVAKVCRDNGVLLLVDNAHGAYLKFLEKSLHPIDLGAHMCSDSAHKTFPALTGGAYLHISEDLSEIDDRHVKNALSMFSSTSPSYLILQSLDMVNAYLATGYKEKLTGFIPKVEALKERMKAYGYVLSGHEPLKITVNAKSYGYRGTELSGMLLSRNIVCEFADPDFLVLMLTPEIGEKGFKKLESALLSVPRKSKICGVTPKYHSCKKIKSIREAMLSPGKTVKTEDSIGRILASPSVGCPPAVPIVVCGELIDEAAVEIFKYYGIEYCDVIK